jgi:predicted nucleic acid-binding protein
MKKRTVFDTNILISAVLFPNGKPFQCTALAKREIITSITCREKIKAISAYNKNQINIPNSNHEYHLNPRTTKPNPSQNPNRQIPIHPTSD